MSSWSWSVDVLADGLTAQGKKTEAEALFREELGNQQTQPRDSDVAIGRWRFKLAQLCRSEGKLAEADALMVEVAKSGNPKVFNYIAWKLATSPLPASRDGTNAVIFGEKAAAATRREDGDILDTLAAAYAEAGQFENAVRTQKEAIALVKEEKKLQAGEYYMRLKLYEANKPFHESGSSAAPAGEAVEPDESQPTATP